MRQKDEVPLNFFQLASKATASVIYMQNKVSLKRSKEQSNYRQHSFANCSCCVFNQQPHRVVFLLIPSTLPPLFTTDGEGLNIKRMQRQLQDICIAVNN